MIKNCGSKEWWAEIMIQFQWRGQLAAQAAQGQTGPYEKMVWKSGTFAELRDKLEAVGVDGVELKRNQPS
jgi:hypothetical protein